MILVPLSNKQLWSFQQSTARICIWDGAVRSGKTFSSLLRWLKAVKEAKSGELMMVGKTERTLKRNILDPIRDLVGEERFDLKSGSGECILFGKVVYLAGANDERAEGKIRGLTLRKLYGDELTLWPESFFTMALSRLSLDGAQLIGTTNPDGPHHWLNKKYLERADELDLRRFRFRLDDNPSLSPAFVNALKREYVGLWYQRFVLGRWVQAEGAIYDMLDPRRHVVDILPAMNRYWAAIDYGTTNPCVFLLLGEGKDGRLYVVDEWRWDSRQKLRQMTDTEYSRAFMRWIGQHQVQLRRVFIDPSAASFQVQLWRDNVPHVVDADNEVLGGIRSIATLLSNDLLRFHRRAEATVQELSNYVWDPKAQERGEDAPLKREDHGPDALRYGINGLRLLWSRWLTAKKGAA